MIMDNGIYYTVVIYVILDAYWKKIIENRDLDK
jgi:hypothetical protein